MERIYIQKKEKYREDEIHREFKKKEKKRYLKKKNGRKYYHFRMSVVGFFFFFFINKQIFKDKRSFQ